MRLFLVFFATIVVYSTGGSPGILRPGTATGTRQPNPLLKQRNEIIRSVLVAHPHWRAPQISVVVQPLLKEAGLKPVSFPLLQDLLKPMRDELQVSRTALRFHPQHATYLRSLFATEPSLTPADAWVKFQSVWGPNAEPSHRVWRWWYDARRGPGRIGAATSGAPRMSSPPSRSADSRDMSSDPDSDMPPVDWWDLGKEFDKFAISDSR